MTQAFPASILLLEDMPRLLPSSVTVVLFNNNGHPFLRIDDVSIGQGSNGLPAIGPPSDNASNLLYGMMIHFTMSPLTQVPTTLCRNLNIQVDAGTIYSLPRSPRTIQTLHLSGLMHSTALKAARRARPTLPEGPYTYYICGFFGSCLYGLYFDNDISNDNTAHVILGQLRVSFGEATIAPTLRANTRSTRHVCQREDAMTGGKGGVMSHIYMEGASGP